MKKKKVSEKENEWKGILQEDSRIAYLIPSNSRIPLECKVNTNLDEDLKYTTEKYKKMYGDIDNHKFFTKEQEEKLKELANQLPVNNYHKEKRIDFEFTPLTFWQLIPSIAINLHCKEIELTWLCFGMYINFKRNG